MRSLIKINKVPVKEDALVPKIFKMQTREEAEMMETALWLGYAVMPVDKLRRELAQSIASRMVNRTGEFVYQSTAFSLINFPLTVLQTDRLPGAPFVHGHAYDQNVDIALGVRVCVDPGPADLGHFGVRRSEPRPEDGLGALEPGHRHDLPRGDLVRQERLDTGGPGGGVVDVRSLQIRRVTRAWASR